MTHCRIGKVTWKSNVVPLYPSPASTLACLMQENLDYVLVLAVDKQGEPRICSSSPDELRAMRLVETARNWLLQGDAA